MLSHHTDPGGTRVAWQFLLLSGLVACMLVMPAQATDSTAREYAVKAAFLVNFADFIDWPGSARTTGEPVTIGVVGDDPFGKTLDAIVETKSTQHRRYEVRRYQKFEDLGSCQIIFVTDIDAERGRTMVRTLSDRPVLTVGETDAFAQWGGIVRFFVHEERVRFEINQAAAERAGLKVSAKLLRLQKKAPR